MALAPTRAMEGRRQRVQFRHKEHLSKLTVKAGIYFFLVKGLLWVCVPWVAYHVGFL